VYKSEVCNLESPLLDYGWVGQETTSLIGTLRPNWKSALQTTPKWAWLLLLLLPHPYMG